ncbi:MAG: hypothetical protein NT169_13730 [Chloroflexi bacterium]|nr:hypothetical protein [Chloroflexota bacterium]
MTQQRLLRILGTVAALAMVVALVSSAFASAPQGPAGPNSLSATGKSLPRAASIAPQSPPVAAGITVNDGSFEYGPPPDSLWTEVTDSACEWIGDWSSAWGVAAYDGTYDFWAGGYCSGIPTSSLVEQDLAVPVDDTSLTFWYLSYRPDPDDPIVDDYAYILADGGEVWHLDFTQANDTFPNWGQATIDLSAWAGLTVHLKFGAVSTGDLAGNIRYDFIGVPTYPSGPCPVETALAGQAAEKSNLQVLRELRDGVMAGTPAGRKYVDLYYRHAAEISGILLRDAALRGRTATLIEKYLPAARALVGQPGGRAMVLTAKDVRQIEALLDDVAAQGSPELAATLAGVRIQVAGAAGKSVEAAWQSLAQ